MAAVWNPSPGAGGKQGKSSEKTERELRRLRFDVKQYDSQLKKLQREVVLKNAELKKLKSCGACTCLGDRRRTQRQGQTAEVRDLGTFGSGASRGMADRARLEIHGRRPASVAGDKRTETVAERRHQQTPALRRSRTEIFQHGVFDGGADNSATLADRDRELARLHQELAQLRTENSSLKEAAARNNHQHRKLEDENAKTLRELGRQVHELESELLKLREERYRLLAESEQLRGEVNSKETNLLRCETQLTKSEREKNELLGQVRRLENKERQLTDELNEYRKRSSGTARSAGVANDPQTGSPSRMHRWNSDLALSRGALANGHGIESDNPGESRRTAEHSHRRNGAVSGNGYHHGTTTAPVLESSTRTRDCNPYCEVCRIYRSKLVKHSDRRLGVLNGAASTSHFGTSQAQAELELRKAELESLRAKHKAAGIDTAIDSGYSDIEKESRPHQDNVAMQRELDQYIDQLEKQKRLLQKYLNEIQSYERTVSEKDREINKMKTLIRELQRNFECVQKHLSERDATLLQLQRELSNASMVKEKMEQGRSALGDDYKRLEQQYQKALQDKAGLQQELTLCLEEQDKQKRQVQRYLSDNQNYERLLGDKDREISKLKATIRDLERDYDIFRKNLTDQEANLLRLQRDLSTANAMKEKTEQGRVVLADDYKRLQQQYQKMYQDKAALHRELELCVEEQDKQKRLLQRYLNEIQSYERLLADKEKERMEMLLQFQASAERVCKCGNSPPRN